MADLSWIDPLFKNARSAFGLDPKAAAEGKLMQKHGDLYDAQTETERYRAGQLLPAQKGVFDADRGHKIALTEGVGLKNKGAQAAADFLADDKNYITTQDGRRVPDPVKLSALFSAASLSAGDKTIQHLPGFVGGMNLQATPLSPGANLAAGGANAAAGASMLKPIALNPDQTLVQKDPLTGQPITGAPGPSPQLTLPNVGGQVEKLPAGTEVIPQGKYDPKAIADVLSASNAASMGKTGVVMPPSGQSNLPYTAPASSTKLTIAEGKNETDILKAEKQIEAKIAIAEKNGASREEVARIRNEGALEVAKIRKSRGSSASGAAGAGEDGGMAPIDLNRLAEREKAAAEYLVNSFGKSGHNIDPNHAALLAAAATQSFPNDPAGVAIQKFMTQNGITSDTGGWSRVDFSQGGKPMDFNALRTKLFGAQQGAAASATGAPGTPITGGNQPQAGGVASVMANGANAAGQRPEKVEIEGIPFTAAKNVTNERKDGDKYTGINTATGQIETRYWDAKKNEWSDQPMGGRQSDLDTVNEAEGVMRGDRSVFSPNGSNQSEKAETEDQILKRGLDSGVISKQDYDAVTQFGRTSGSKRSTAFKVVEKLKAMEAETAKRDPRVDAYSKGDFLDDKGIPDDALELAERMGIDRAAYGLPQKVDYTRKGTNIAGNIWDDLRGSAVGPLVNPAGYSEERDAIEKGLKSFFADIKAGRPPRVSPKPVEAAPAEAAPELPAETKVEPPSTPKGVPTQTKEEPVEKVPKLPELPESVADVVAPKKEISKEAAGKEAEAKKADEGKKKEKPKSVADVVTPEVLHGGRKAMTPDEIKIMLAEDFRKEIERRNKNRP